jgi:hypothetical protein
MGFSPLLQKLLPLNFSTCKAQTQKTLGEAHKRVTFHYVYSRSRPAGTYMRTTRPFLPLFLLAYASISPINSIYLPNGKGETKKVPPPVSMGPLKWVKIPGPLGTSTTWWHCDSKCFPNTHQQLSVIALFHPKRIRRWSERLNIFDDRVRAPGRVGNGTSSTLSSRALFLHHFIMVASFSH